MTQEEILQLIKMVSASNLTAFRYKDNDVSLELEAMGRTEAEPVITNRKLPVQEIETEKEELLVIKSPMVGTFYASKSEKSEPFIQVGDKIKKGQVIGIVEAMKLMNEIEADCDGVVEKIAVQNKSMIEYGQPLVFLKAL